MTPEIARIYGQTVRVRICGLCWQDDRLLLVNHRGLTAGDFWAPPGGGLEFGESTTARLQKEFLEETGLHVAPGPFRFACEFVQPPLHAIELYFEVTSADDNVRKGDDPELPIITAAEFMTPAQIARIPPASLHGIFKLVDSVKDLQTLNGFFRI